MNQLKKSSMLVQARVNGPKSESKRSFCGKNTIFLLGVCDLLKNTILYFIIIRSFILNIRIVGNKSKVNFRARPILNVKSAPVRAFFFNFETLP